MSPPAEDSAIASVWPRCLRRAAIAAAGPLLAPGITQGHGAVESLVSEVRDEVAMALELEPLFGFSTGERRLQLRGYHAHGGGVQVLDAVRIRHLEEPVVEPHFGAMRVCCAHPVDIPLHLEFVGAGRA